MFRYQCAFILEVPTVGFSFSFRYRDTSFFDKEVVGFGIIQFLSWLGFFGLFVLVVGKGLSKMNLIPTGDPNLEEGLHLHQ